MPSKKKPAATASTRDQPKQQQGSAAPAPAKAATEQPKYTPPQASFLCEYVVFPLYDQIVKLYPRFWTPNGITLFGIFCTLTASLVLLTAMPPHISGNGVGGNDPRVWSVKAATAASSGLYERPVHPLAASLRTAVNEIVAGPAAVKAPKAGQLGKAWQYDFQRPTRYLYQVVTIPFDRVFQALAGLYLTAADAVFELVSHFAGKDAAATVRVGVFEGLEEPVRGLYERLRTAAEELRIAAAAESPLVSVPGRAMLIVAGILNLLYCIADNTDGRHARRTKQASYVGEYLDHGLDCVTSLMSAFLLLWSLGIEPAQAGAGLLSIAVATVLSHIVNQEHGVMIWGNRLFSVDEAMLGFGFGLIAVGAFPAINPALATPIGQLADLKALPFTVPPALALATVAEVGVALFILAQLQVILSMLSVSRTVLFRPAALLMYANVSVLALFVNHLRQPATVVAAARHLNRSVDTLPALNAIVEPASRLAALIATDVPQALLPLLLGVERALNQCFTYEAQWVIVAACTCSIIAHGPIAAKCLKVPRGVPLVPLLVALLPVWFVFFFLSSAVGLLVAVGMHSLQISINILSIELKGRADARKKKQ